MIYGVLAEDSSAMMIADSQGGSAIRHYAT
jgi:hypothetical protein